MQRSAQAGGPPVVISVREFAEFGGGSTSKYLQGRLNRKEEVAAHRYARTFAGVPLGHVRHAFWKYHQPADFRIDAVKDAIVFELTDEDQVPVARGNADVLHPRQPESRQIAHAVGAVHGRFAGLQNVGPER